MNPHRVLIIDGHDDSRVIYRMILELAGFTILEADRGDEGLRSAREHNPELVFVDLCLPVVDGLHVLRSLKSDDGTRDIPVVVLTSCADPALRGEAVESRCDRFLLKPCAPRQLLEVASELLEGGGGGARCPDPAEHGDPMSPGPRRRPGGPGNGRSVRRQTHWR